MGLCQSTNNKNSANGVLTPDNGDTALHSDVEHPSDMNSGLHKTKASQSEVDEKKKEDLRQKILHEFKEAEHLGGDAIRKIRREMGDWHYHAETCIPGIYTEDGLHDLVPELYESYVVKEAKAVFDSQEVGFKALEGKPRTLENYRTAWDKIRKAIGDETVQFPEILDVQTLGKLVAHNPFVSMGLSFEDGQLCWNASTESKNPITAAVMSALNYQTAQLYFTPDLIPTKLVLEKDGAYAPDHPDFDTKLRAFITPMLYFFEVVHATLHVWTYVMLNAAEHATFATEMEGFVKQYEPQIFVKYQEVALLLFNRKEGLLCGQLWQNVNTDNCLKAAKQIFELLSAQRNSRDWYENIFCAGLPQLIDNDMALPLAQPYVKMFENLSSKTMQKLRQKVEDQYFVDLQDINDRLNQYLNLCDAKADTETMFGLSNFSQWIECQGMAGVLHGSTLGLTRLIFTKYCVLDGNWSSTTIDKNFEKTQVAVGTLLGLEEEHAVNEQKPLDGTPFHHMMGEFQSETKKLQNDFWDSLSEDERLKHRWIFSVWGPNMLDNTQLTITTYV